MALAAIGSHSLYLPFPHERPAVILRIPEVRLPDGDLSAHVQHLPLDRGAQPARSRNPKVTSRRSPKCPPLVREPLTKFTPHSPTACRLPLSGTARSAAARDTRPSRGPPAVHQGTLVAQAAITALAAPATTPAEGAPQFRTALPGSSDSFDSDTDPAVSVRKND